MDNQLKVLILEDREADAELIVHALKRGGFRPVWQRVDCEDHFRAALDLDLDIILADYSLPQFDALQALHRLQATGLDIPFIIITGFINEETAVECIKQGASDYLLKDRLARLPSAIDQALYQKRLARAKKSAEVALQESEALNRGVLNSLSSQIAVLDDQGVIIATNNAWDHFSCEAISIPSQNMEAGGRLPLCPADGVLPENPANGWIGQSYLEVCRKSASAGEKDAQQALEGIQSVVNGSSDIFTMEYAAQAEHRTRWFSMMVTPLAAAHRGAVVTHNEITIRKQAEERLRMQSAALDSSPTATLITDRDGIIEWVNPAFTTLTGYSFNEAVGHPSRLFNPAAHDATSFRKMWSTIVSGQVWHSEILNRRKNGSVYTSEITIAPVRDDQGEITHFIDIEQDITERKQHERELEAIVVVANALRTARSRAEMLPMVMDQLFELLKATGASISLYDPSSDEMVVTLSRGPFVGESGTRVPAGEGLTGEVITSRQIYLKKDASPGVHFSGSNGRDQRKPAANGPLTIAGMPLIAQGLVIGLIWLVRTSEILPNEERLLSAIADMAANAIYRASLYEETERRLQRLTSLREIDKAITASLDLNTTLMVLVEQVLHQLGMDAADVLLFTPETQSLEYSVGKGFRSEYIPTSRLLSQAYAHQAVLTRKVISLPDLASADNGLLEKIRSRGEDINAYFAVPLMAKSQVKGVLELFKRSIFTPQPEWLNFLEMLAAAAAIAIDNAELFDHLQRSNIRLAMAYDDTIEGWSRALDLRDRETEGHSQRVTEMTMRLARVAGIREAELVHIRRGALLHDIGKMAIPDATLLKPGPHNLEEAEIIRKHPQFAYELLSPIDFLHDALHIPYCHHEHWDGSGYPRGLKGEAIPLAARIFSVVDVFDALISDRPYRQGWPKEKVLAYIQEQSGILFDPKIVALFLSEEW